MTGFNWRASLRVWRIFLIMAAATAGIVGGGILVIAIAGWSGPVAAFAVLALMITAAVSVVEGISS